jgi:hypothetical protein
VIIPLYVSNVKKSKAFQIEPFHSKLTKRLEIGGA